jgi:class 3 adenylate cyclase/tetratricopeptide (TPR) repeat protein
VLFCDLVGFTPLSETRDPEEVRELLSEYFDVARTVIGRYGGVVEKFIGDAVMAVWGTPTATEGDAERAVRAALDLVDSVAALGRESANVELSARAGLVTGPVAVTVGATGEGMVAGDAVNTAARIQAVAEPNAVWVDEVTRRLAEAGVGFSSTGDHVLKGKADPVPLWRADRVLSGVGGSQRIDGLEAGFVGRGTELRLVKELFHSCAERRTPRLVSVTGAAGVGKSRLGWEFEKYVDGLAGTVRWHRGRCLSYGDGVAFWALAEMVRQRLQIAEEDASSVAADKLAAGLESLLTDADERMYVGPRLAQLLGVEYGEPGPELGRDELFAGWRLFFERLAGADPVVMVVEDLQYADVGLLDFLEHLLDWARNVPIFVLTLARPELEARRAGWGSGRRNTTTLTLDPLDDRALDELLDGLVPGMPSSAKAAIAARAEGVPLYAVETVRMLVDRDVVRPIEGVYRLVGDVGDLSVPATLQSLLAARLDTLEPAARRLIADAAVLGGSFPADALVAVSDQPETQVRQLLAELVRREVLGVRADPLSPQRGQYGFVQTMFRQVAYDTLSRRERKVRHLAVAAHLQTVFADGGEEIAEVIAAHLIDALKAVPDDPDVLNLQGEAVGMLTRAGDRAVRTGAPAAAVAAYTAAADLLQQQATAEAEVGAATLHEPAGKAASDLGDQDAAVAHYQIAADMYRRHKRMRDAARAEVGLGAALRRQGRLEDAGNTLRNALSVLRAEPDADTVAALAQMAILDAFIGNGPEADQGSAAVLAQAQALGLPDSVFAELFLIRGIAHGLASRPVQAAANLREAIRRAEATQNGADAARGLLNLGDVLLNIDPQASVEATRAALVHTRRIGSRYAMGFAVANMIQALMLTGDWDGARQDYATAVADDGLAEDRAVAQAVSVLHALSGDSAKLADTLNLIQQDTSEDPQDRAMTATALAAAGVLAGDQAEALRQAQIALGHGVFLSPGTDAVRWSWPFAADAAIALGEWAEVTRLLEWIEEHPPGHIPALLRAARLLVLARLPTAAGDDDRSAHFDAAVKAFREAGSPYHVAVALLDHADHLRATGDPETARQVAGEATEIARRLGARPLLERASRLSDREGSRQLLQ